MQQQSQPRAASFLLVMSWIYLLVALGMIGFALYKLTNTDVTLTFAGVTDAVFLIIGGVLGFLAGIFGLVSKNLKRCRIIGLVLLGIAAVPLVINLLAGEGVKTYWKNIAVMVLPFLYLLAALIKRSAKKPQVTPQQPAQPSEEDLSQYAAPAPKPAAAPQAQQTPQGPVSETEQPKTE
ncbi:MAG: hypothetical protein GX417_03000 [Clostridiales bacterium]|nr:hypothetical protein [Clostridiales bacterium]